MSDPFMSPFGLKPKPTQPVVLTASWNVMSPAGLSKPHFRHTSCSWSRYSIKGIVTSIAHDPVAQISSREKKGSGEHMMPLQSCKAETLQTELNTSGAAKLPPTIQRHTCVSRSAQVIVGGGVKCSGIYCLPLLNNKNWAPCHILILVKPHKSFKLNFFKALVLNP